MKQLKNTAAKFLLENGFNQMANQVKKCNSVAEIISNVKFAAGSIYNTTSNPKREELKLACDRFVKIASLIA